MKLQKKYNQYTITVPMELVKHYGLRKGDEIHFFRGKGNEMVIRWSKL